MTAFAVAVLLTGAYAVALARRRSAGRVWPPLRTASWLVGVALVAAALSAPLAAAAHHDPRAHMVQHLLLGMYAPLALVLAAPVTLLLGALAQPGRRRVARVLHSPVARGVSHPVVVVLLSSGGLWVLYLTPLHALASQTPWMQHLVSLHFVLSGALVAWVVAGPDPAPRRPGLPVRALVLLVSAASHAALAKVLYAHAGVLPGGAAHGDPAGWEDAAQLMYYGGDVAEILLAVALGASWLQARRHARRRQPLLAPLACATPEATSAVDGR